VEQTDTIEAELHAARALESAGRVAEATDLLRRAAARGNVAALAALGKHLLIHRPDCAGEGLNALSTAAQGGNGESAYLLAVFIAEGVGFPQSWQAAFAALQHAAELKWLPAQREIEFLTSEFKGTGGKDLDLSQWLQAPSAHLLSPTPRIFAVKNFASPRMCDWLIELARPRLKAAQTFDPDTGVGQYESSSNNSDCHLILPYSNLVLALVRARIAALIQMPPPFFEPPTMLHYKPGETFSPHYDFLDDTKPGLSK
jgi:prolyl 4-hydroxylase